MTRLRNAEAHLYETPTIDRDARFQGAFDHAVIGMALAAPDGRCLQANAALCEILGFSEEELRRMTFDELTHPDDRGPSRALFDRALAGELRRYRTEKRYLHRRGHVVWIALDAALVRDADGVPLYFVGQMQDITERKRVEGALRASEARHQRHLANSPGVAYQFVARPNGASGFTVVSEGARRLFGVDPAAALQDAAVLLDLIHPDDRPGFDESRAQAGRELAPWRWAGRLVLPNGEERWVEVMSRFGRDPDGTIICDGILMDVTAVRDAAARMEESEQRFRSLFDRHPDAVISIDAAGRIESANAACAAVSGYAPGERLGDPFTALLESDEAEIAVSHFKAALAGSGRSFETSIRHKRGHAIPIGVTVVPMVIGDRVAGAFGIIKDLSQQHSLEAQLRHAQKMEAVGRLAGGIAHDFNNLLTAILANAELALGALPDGAVRDDVTAIRQTAQRAAALTHQLLAFSRKQVTTPRLVALNSLVEETERMLRRTLAENIDLDLDLTPLPVTVKADPSQLEQVLLNLAVNAGDAMPAGGTLTLRTQATVVDEAFAARHRGLVPGEYVTLAVEDTGVGIPAELQSRIFEPFFTTKDVDRGTGLGLATVYGIAKQYGGYVMVSSEVGRGATFTVFLPRADAGDEAGPVKPRIARRLPTGTERVLVVEDEPTVRTSIQRVLQLHGYTVLEARNGAEALRIAEQAEEPIDMVMTDLIMPVMGGRELVGALRARGADPAIMVISGYDEQAALQGDPLPGNARFLEKPFTMESLLHTVRATLDAEVLARRVSVPSSGR